MADNSYARCWKAPLKFERDGKTYRFSAPVATGKLIAGAMLPTFMASPMGGEPSSGQQRVGHPPAGGVSPNLRSLGMFLLLRRMQAHTELLGV
jgi:hypothetical protein